MPEYLPLGAFRQGLLPGDCRSCAWWQTAGRQSTRGHAASEKRHEWLDRAGARLGPCRPARMHEPSASGARQDPEQATRSSRPPSTSPRRRHSPGSGTFPSPRCPRPRRCCSASTPTRMRPAGWPSGSSARRSTSCASRGVERGVSPSRTGRSDPVTTTTAGSSRPNFLADNGFEQVTDNGHLCLMRVDNRGLVSLIDQVEAAVRRVFAKEPAPSPAAWVQGGNGAEQGTP